MSTVTRVNLSLPCSVPVLPGTPDGTAPIEERTETCNVDAWFVIGRAPICDLHLKFLLGDEDVDEMVRSLEEADGWPPPPAYGEPWEGRHRYEQKPSALPSEHPVRLAHEGGGR